MFVAIGAVSDDRKTVMIWAVLSCTTSSWTSKALKWRQEGAPSGNVGITEGGHRMGVLGRFQRGE